MVRKANRNYLDKGYVELYDLSSSTVSLNKLYETVGNLASICYGNEEAKNPIELGKKLEKLGHLSVFEFIRSPEVRHGRCYYSGIKDSFRNTRRLLYNGKAHRCCIATFKIKAPIFVVRQLMRHRCFSFLELSRRYTTHKKKPYEFYIPKDFPELVEAFYNHSVALYEELLAKGFKQEQARIILPQSLYTELWLQGDVECFQNFFALRLDEHAQYEIRELAKTMSLLLQEFQPEFGGGI